jgi:small-conductance mechanosensitive channel
MGRYNVSVADVVAWSKENPALVVRVAVLVAALPLSLFASRLLRKTMAKRLSPQMSMLVAKFVAYSAILIILLTLLRELNVPLAPLLGAAGVVGVAIGFAAQTSLSNLISGIFLIMEKPFLVGDIVRMDQHLGVVHSIDLLSVKIRTFDNTLIRIPNEAMIKSAVTTVTAFPIRRMDVTVGVAYKEDVGRVMALLRDIADGIPLILDEPEPFILFKGFGDSALEITVGVWLAKADYIAVRNTLLPTIKKRFDEEGVEIPFPHRTLYTGAITDPFPIRLVGSPDMPANMGSERG